MRRIQPIIRQWWYRLWIRNDEFDISLSFDTEYYSDLKDDLKKRLEYEHDLCKRREIAHRRDMAEMEKKYSNYYSKIRRIVKL